MNVGRIASAAVAATIADVVYGFLVYGTLLASQFAHFPNVYRSAETGPGYLPLMFAGLFVSMIVATMIYAKGYEGGSGLAEGARFGTLLGVFVATAFASVNYATLNIGRWHSLYLACAGFAEWVIVGTVIGLVYKPSTAGSSRRATGV